MTDLDLLTKNIFPQKWQGTHLSEEDVAYDYLALCTELPKLKTKSRIGHANWHYQKLQRLIDNKGKKLKETWNLRKEGRYLLVWEIHSSLMASPAAIMSFTIEVIEKTKTNRASVISLNANLIWVDPAKRRRGFE